MKNYFVSPLSASEKLQLSVLTRTAMLEPAHFYGPAKRALVEYLLARDPMSAELSKCHRLSIREVLGLEDYEVVFHAAERDFSFKVSVPPIIKSPSHLRNSQSLIRTIPGERVSSLFRLMVGRKTYERVFHEARTDDLQDYQDAVVSGDKTAERVAAWRLRLVPWWIFATSVVTGEIFALINDAVTALFRVRK